jgi:dephospho-CoA kinase
MLNKVRQRLTEAIGRTNTNAQKAKTIKLGHDLRNMQKHPGWIALHEWIETQKEGARDALDRSMGHINLITIPLFFNSFLKYFFVLLEIRAYKKIDTFIRITIERGDRYAEEARKRAEREASRSERKS